MKASFVLPNNKLKVIGTNPNSSERSSIVGPPITKEATGQLLPSVMTDAELTLETAGGEERRPREQILESPDKAPRKKDSTKQAAHTATKTEINIIDTMRDSGDFDNGAATLEEALVKGGIATAEERLEI